MDIALGLLTFGTLGFVTAFAYINQRATEKLFQESRARRIAAQRPAHRD